MRAAALRATLFCLIAGAGSAADSIAVGYRSDARPFVYSANTPTGFDGFFARLCDGALARAGFGEDAITRVAVNAVTRWVALETPVEAGGVDFLCDTTSITPERLGRLLYSPIVFVGGVSYAYSPAAEAAQHAGFRAASTPGDAKARTDAPMTPEMRAPYCADAPEGDAPRLPEGRAPLVRVGVIRGTSAVGAVRTEEALRLFRLRAGEAVCVFPVVGGYAEGVERLCTGDVAYFFGDRDMVEVALDSYKAQTECDALLSGKFFSYEPYAFVVRSDRPDLYPRLQAALYDVFRDRDALDAMWTETFGAARRSALLDALFRINAVGLVDAD